MSDYEFLKMVTALMASENKKYLVKCGNDKFSYLNQEIDGGRYFVSSAESSEDYKTQFRIDEIMDAVKSDAIYLDWKRVEFEEVKDNGQNENE